MGGASLPPGFRFHPTDEELVGYYLKRKVEGLEIELEVIPVIDLYKFDPWELPDKSFLPKRDMEWFFFCPRDKKYPNGSRTNRATRAGYWKATGKDRKVVCRQSSVTGSRKTLVFYRGRAPLGDRTDWVMHEYRLSDDLSQGTPSFQGAFALCRVIKKNEDAPKTSDVQGEARRTGNSSSTGDFGSVNISNEPVIIPDDTSFQTSNQCNRSYYSSPIASPYQTMPVMENETSCMGTDSSSLWVSPDFILDSSKDYSQGQRLSGYIEQHEYPNSTTQWQQYNQHQNSPNSSYSNFTDEVGFADGLNQFGCVPPSLGQTNYMGSHGNDHIPFDGYDQINSLGDQWGSF